MKDKKEFCILSKTIIEQIEEKLIKWEESITSSHHEEIKIELSLETSSEIIDQANQANMLSIELEKINRNAKVLKEIRTALKKIKTGTYGICEESGEAIETNRLLANPLARFSLETQQELENETKSHKQH